MHITLAKELMMSEQRRYFRHPVNLHVLLKDEDSQQHAMITDLSDGGMAVRTARPLKYSSLVEFAFDLSFGDRPDRQRSSGLDQHQRRGRNHDPFLPRYRAGSA